MIRLLRAAARRITKRIPFSMYRFLGRNEVVSLTYHVVSPARLPHICHLLSYKTPKAFEQDLLYLGSQYHLLHYDELLAGWDGRARIPANSAVLTFDDGYAECFSWVRPLLLKHNIPCIFFVTTGWIDNHRLFYRNKVSLCIDKLKSLDDLAWRDASRRFQLAFGRRFDDCQCACQWLKSLEIDGETMIDEACDLLALDLEHFLHGQHPYLTLEQIRQLTADGFTVGSHTSSHAKLPLLDKRRAAEEILESSELVREWTGQQYVPFAFPYNADEVDSDFLHHVLARGKFIRLLFGQHRRPAEGIPVVRRMVVDPPLPSGKKSNAPVLLQRAYREALRHDGVWNTLKSCFSSDSRGLC